MSAPGSGINGLLADVLTPIQYDLSNYQRYFGWYDRIHPEAPLGPEPTKEQLLTAIEVCRTEGRMLAEALTEAAGTVGR